VQLADCEVIRVPVRVLEQHPLRPRGARGL